MTQDNGASCDPSRDGEIDTLESAYQTLARLDSEGRVRALRYLRQRFEAEQIQDLEAARVIGHFVRRVKTLALRAPRENGGKPLPSKTPEEYAAARAKAWETRRQRYGAVGHR